VREGDLGTDAALEWMENQLDEVNRIQVSTRTDVRNLAGITSVISKSPRYRQTTDHPQNSGSL